MKKRRKRNRNSLQSKVFDDKPHVSEVVKQAEYSARTEAFCKNEVWCALVEAIANETEGIMKKRRSLDKPVTRSAISIDITSAQRFMIYKMWGIRSCFFDCSQIIPFPEEGRGREFLEYTELQEQKKAQAPILLCIKKHVVTLSEAMSKSSTSILEVLEEGSSFNRPAVIAISKAQREAMAKAEAERKTTVDLIYVNFGGIFLLENLLVALSNENRNLDDQVARVVDEKEQDADEAKSRNEEAEDWVDATADVLKKGEEG